MIIGVTGGSGFIGTHLILSLMNSKDISLRILTHQRQSPFKLSDNIEVIAGSIEDSCRLDDFCKGCDLIIHLVGIIAETKTKTFENTVARGTSLLVESAVKNKVKKIIYLSALGTSEDAQTDYHRTKYKAEQAVINSGIEYLILRASVIYGKGDGFINLLIKLTKYPPFVPVIGHGKYLLQPIYIDDLVKVFLSIIEQKDIKNKIIDVAGPEKLEYKETLNILLKQLNRKRIYIHFPVKPVKLIAGILEKIMKPAPVTRDQITMMEMGNTGDITLMIELFRFEPVLFSNGLKKYL